jgi:hypothetical protein
MSHTEGGRKYERSYLSYESRHNPYAIFTHIQKDGSKFHSVSGYNYKTKKNVSFIFDSYDEAHKKLRELPSPDGYREKRIR